MRKRLSIIIPAYNEQDRIIETLIDITVRMSFLKFDYEIVIIDDGSTDKTAHVIRSYIGEKMLKNIKLISYKPNRGKGHAVRQGLLKSRYMNKLVLDADQSVLCDEIEGLTAEDFKMYGIVTGDREQIYSQPLYRLALGKIWQTLVWLKTGIFADTQSPFKFCRLDKEFYESLTIDSFAYDVELLAKAKREGQLKWLKVSYYNDKNSRVTIRKTMRMFYDLFNIK